MTRRQRRRILVHRVGQIGDLVCTIPVFTALRRHQPGAEIVLLTSPYRRELVGAGELFAAADFVDRIVTYYAADMTLRGVVRLARTLRAERWDVFLELPQSHAPRGRIARDLLFGALIGARRVAGRAAFARTRAGRNEIDRLLALAAAGGLVPADAEVELRLPADPQSALRAAAFLAEHGPRASTWVALNPGAKRQTNRWPSERFVEVGRRLVERGARIVVTGAPSERDLCSAVAAAVGPASVSAAGTASILVTAELLRRCAAVVTNDSGTMHVAAAVGTPAIVAQTARDLAGLWRPWGPAHYVIRKTVPCSPCLRETCDHLTCLYSITADEMAEAALHALGSVPSDGQQRFAGGAP